MFTMERTLIVHILLNDMSETGIGSEIRGGNLIVLILNYNLFWGAITFQQVQGHEQRDCKIVQSGKMPNWSSHSKILFYCEA